ncbi:hypothetical protein IQ247_09070 [Plectonema cf. radiosum LEGE 06105]|uniref:Uncharacterized protein n=1 Tax=Plectonema cf. radiosum LEGE 06105 TaxID=945769 RepID=A0A8J7EZ59_9CYAN|nr:hypothetical protein [Plectonema radiosum]MBE9212841.1 hypothetical protein [Plectonema cf. radiosum LEGE 06105]
MKSYEMLKTLPSENIEPRHFLRYCFDIDQLSSENILEEETSFGYCSKCVKLLSKILGMKRKTVREWGENPNFEGMPHYAKVTCSYAQAALSKEELNRIIHHDYEAPAVSAMEFIEEILLLGLSPSERLKVISSTKFRGQCFTLLSETLNISKRRLYEWGRDMELRDMPRHYQHTLAYAIAVYKKRQQTTAKQSAA